MSMERALADLAQLDAEAQRARNRLAEIDEQAGRLRTYVAVAREYERTESGRTTPTPSPTPRPTTGASGEGTLSRRTADMAVGFIEAKGQPIHTRDLLALMAARGVSVGGSNPVANLSGFLSRDKARLVSSRTYGWSLRKWGNATSLADMPSQQNLNGHSEPRLAGIVGAMDDAATEGRSVAEDEHDPRDPDSMFDAATIDQAVAEHEAAALAADAEWEARVEGPKPSPSRP